MATDHKPSTVLWNDLVPVLWNLQGTQSKESSSTPGSESVRASQKNWNLNRDQIANISWIMEKAREFRKTSTSASLTTLKFDCVDGNKLENS